MSDASLLRTTFPATVIEQIGFYVYRLIDPRDSQTFYIGKGTGNRLFHHVAQANDLPDRGSLKFDRIRDIERSGFKVQYLIHRHGLTEPEALLVESSLIDAYPELSNAALGHSSSTHGVATVDELIARYDAESVQIDVPCLLVNLRRQFERGLSADQLYSRTRGYWTLRPDRHPEAKYCMAFAFGAIREVYVISTWTRHDTQEIAEDSLRRAEDTIRASKVRWSFDGVVAFDVRERFVGKGFNWPGQSAFIWKNC